MIVHKQLRLTMNDLGGYVAHELNERIFFYIHFNQSIEGTSQIGIRATFMGTIQSGIRAGMLHIGS